MNDFAIKAKGIETAGNFSANNKELEKGVIPCLTDKEAETVLRDYYKTDCALCLMDDFYEGFARIIFIKEGKAGYGFINQKTKKLAFNESIFKASDNFQKREGTEIPTATVIFENGDEGFINICGKPTVTKAKRRRRVFFKK